MAKKTTNQVATKRTGYRREKPNVKVKSNERVTLSPRESTRITGFGLTQTYRLLRTQQMPNIVVGKRFFIPKTALLKWLDNAGSNQLAAD